MSELSDSIKQLYSEGNSYNKIAEMLSCAKSTVAYHCGEGQKDKSDERRKNRRASNTMLPKVDKFRCASSIPSERVYTSTPEDQQRFKYLDFQREGTGKRNVSFTFRDILDKVGDEPTCYLSGRPIDLSDARSYELDHIIPRSKGGDNSLGNLGVAVREANRAKGQMTNEEFIALCIDVVQHNGYTLVKSE